jgi:hypothetical protein
MCYGGGRGSLVRSGNLRLRTSILIPLLAALLPFAVTAQTVSSAITIAQLRDKLAAFTPAASGQGSGPMARFHDATLAGQIDNLRLSERLTAPALAEILAAGTFGQQAQQSLQLLADRSALLDPPASEQPNLPAPDASQQQQMLGAARVYVLRTLMHLPNFFATRTTARFYGVPPELNESGMPVQLGLRSRGSYSREITFREGKEVIDPMKHPQGAESVMPILGMESWGEFGPEPAVILTDVAVSMFTFHHWEKGLTGPVAVYHYSVPQPESHYEVNYACNGSPSFHAQPAYQGTLALDPATGAILRVTIQASSKAGDPLSHVASVVEYGPVEIGGKTYICPLHSLAFSVVEANSCTHEQHNISVVQPMYLNRTTFTDYHRLGSTWRIVPDAAGATQAPQK